MNPMLMSLFSSRLGPIRQMIGAVKAAQNPMAALQQMAGQNPQLQQALQLVQQSGGDPQAALNKLCQERGIDPQQILSMLNGFNS
jgi:hypothetical protein